MIKLPRVFTPLAAAACVPPVQDLTLRSTPDLLARQAELKTKYSALDTVPVTTNKWCYARADLTMELDVIAAVLTTRALLQRGTR